MNLVRPPFREDEFFLELALDRGMSEPDIEKESQHRRWMLDISVRQFHTHFWWLMGELGDDLATFSTSGLSYIHHMVESDTYPPHQYPELRELFHDMIRFMMVRIQPWLTPEVNHRVLEQAILCHDPILVRILVESGCHVTPSIVWTAEGNLSDYVPMHWSPFSKHHFLHPEILAYVGSVPLHEEDWCGEYTACRDNTDGSDSLGNGLEWAYSKNVLTIMEEIVTLGYAVTGWLD